MAYSISLSIITNGLRRHEHQYICYDYVSHDKDFISLNQNCFLQV